MSETTNPSARSTDALMTRHQIAPYRGSPERLRQIAVAFTGSLRYSGDADKVLLLSDPLSQQAFFYEFRAADVLYGEEQPSVSMPDGSTVAMVRIWVRKGADALKIVPFHVQDTSAILQQWR